MSFEGFLVTPLTIRNPADKTDRYGNTIDDWDNASSVTTRGWRSQRDTLELTDNRAGVVTQEILYLNPDSTVTARSRIDIGTEKFAVEGDPHLARTPSGVHHIELAIRKVAG